MLFCTVINDRMKNIDDCETKLTKSVGNLYAKLIFYDNIAEQLIKYTKEEAVNIYLKDKYPSSTLKEAKRRIIAKIHDVLNLYGAEPTDIQYIYEECFTIAMLATAVEIKKRIELKKKNESAVEIKKEAQEVKKPIVTQKYSQPQNSSNKQYLQTQRTINYKSKSFITSVKDFIFSIFTFIWDFIKAMFPVLLVIGIIWVIIYFSENSSKKDKIANDSKYPIENTNNTYRTISDEERRMKENETFIHNSLNTGDSPYDNFFGNGVYVNSSLSEITIKNGTQQDAVVIFQKISSKKVVRNIYIRAGNDYIAKKFPEGIYEMKCYYGNGWNPQLNNGVGKPIGGFVSNVSYSAATHAKDYFDMRTEETYDGYSYPTYTVTLHKVQHGNMQTENISPDDFFN